MLNQTGYSIAYLVVDTLPTSGYRKLLFYTIKDGKYYWGTGNNSFSLEEMQKQELDGKILKLPTPKPLEEKMGIWVNNIGEIYYADLVNPVQNDPGLEYLCTFDVSLFY
ncbi:MAG: hypothetical protein K9M36_00130 [Candidatus Pacebacteria bacterium]|nr:hypothetical protein [Candidatus Paceibacterota bacterium]